MSEEIQNNEVEVEVVAPEVESEGNETPVEKIEEKVIDRPWKKKEEVEETSIPYNRFKEVNEERKAYREKLEQYEKELAQYKTPPKEKTVDDIDPADFSTVAEYLKAREDFVAEQTEKRFIERMDTMRRQKEAEEYQNNIVKSFQTNVEEAMTRNPEVVEAVQYLEKYSNRIPAEVRLAMLTDDNAGDLCFEIATNPKLFETVMSGDVVKSIREITKWSAKFERGDVIEKKSEAKVDHIEDIRAMVPKTVRATPTSKKDPSKMSMSEYRAYRNGK